MDIKTLLLVIIIFNIFVGNTAQRERDHKIIELIKTQYAAKKNS